MAFKHLEFVKDKDFWAVTHTGDWSRDTECGRQFAREALVAMEASDAPNLLGSVVRSMIAHGQYGGVEAGFLSVIGTAASGH